MKFSAPNGDIGIRKKNNLTGIVVKRVENGTEGLQTLTQAAFDQRDSFLRKA
jgi:hypothetical protein